MRKPRKGEITCTCRAYKFPHRMMGGACQGKKWVSVFWDKNQSDECRQCNNYVEDYSNGCHCDVIMGVEPPRQCPELATYLDFEEVPVPKNLRRKSWR